MANVKDFNIEFDNLRNSQPYAEIVEVVNAGTPVSFSPSGTIVAVMINVPRIGPNAGTNTPNRYILYSVDGGLIYHTVPVSGYVALPGALDSIFIDASHDGMKAEVEARIEE
jgi:hypothetical protein